MKKSKNKSYSIQRASMAAGISLLLMAILAAYANFGVLKRLTVEGNDMHTAYNFSGSIGSVRVAILCFVVVAFLDVVVALALYRVFERVNKGVARLAAFFRLVYAGAFMVAITQLVLVSSARGGEAYTNYVRSGYNTDYILGITHDINNFSIIWKAGLILFGIHLLLIGFLAFKANYAPKLLGALLVVAGLGYLIDSISSLFITGYATNIASVTFIGEVVLIFWLLLKGRRLKVVG